MGALSRRAKQREKVRAMKEAGFYAAKAALQWAASGSLDRHAMTVPLGMAAWHGYHVAEGPTVKRIVE